MLQDMYDDDGYGYWWQEAAPAPEVEVPLCQDGSAHDQNMADSDLTATSPVVQTSLSTSTTPRAETATDKFLLNLSTADMAEIVGEPLASEALANKITALMRGKPTVNFEKDGLAKILRPENCPGLSPVRVNDTIWPELSKSAQ